MVRPALRTTAVLIAVAAVIDPVMTTSRPAATEVVLADLTSGGFAPVESAVRSALSDSRISVRRPGHGRLPCEPGETCVMVADGSVDAGIPEDLDARVSLVPVGAPADPNVAIQSVTASSAHHAAGSGTVRVVMTGAGMAGRRTDVRVADAGAIVGSAQHAWTADGAVSLDVPWWPAAEGARSLRVTAEPFDGETSAIDNAVTVGVNVASLRAAVLVFDARPSWASTFVRRALEDDGRFLVGHRVGLAPSLAAGTAATRIDERSLDAAAVVMVGSPESVAAGDVPLLERYVRQRGGTLVLLPDRAPAGPAARLFPGRWTEHLEATASPVGALRASETLRLTAPSPLDVVLGSVKGSAAIVVSPAGRGRIVVSGALDAWRYRDAAGAAFDRFWRSLVLESAALSVPLSIDFARSAAPPGGEVPLVVRHRRMNDSAAVEIAATVTCGDRAARVLRLWPSGREGEFTGTVAIEGAGPCEVRAAIDGGPSAVAGIAVSAGATEGVSAVLAKLERAARRTGGTVVNASDADAVRAALATPQVERAAAIRPMHSPWWMFPFVTCLAAEWWLRRRAGLR
ncbi:MAG: hypothetical protein AB7P34_19575, partial [Vicinamibacterales bacterium]